MKFLNKIYSKIDKVVKYVFEYNKQIVELSYIDNGTGKDIICVPTHTMCNLGCKFCHTTDYIGKIPIVKITFHEIFYGINYIINDLKLNNNTLLISYMGCGEQFNCTKLDIIDGMDLVRLNYSYEKFKNVRFGIATCLPKDSIVNFFIFCNSVKERKIIDAWVNYCYNQMDDLK